jgi:ribose/xylose/arabinose/galactoside ABC-type transport system permease subunit
MAELAESPQASERARTIARRFFRHENTPLLFVLIGLMLVMGYVTKGATLSLANLRNNLLLTSITGIAAIGQGMVILTSGIDVSVGGNGMFCSLLGAGLMTTAPWSNYIGHPIPVALGALIMLVAGLGWGMVNGSLVAFVGIPALISTLGMWQVTNGVGVAVSHAHDIGYQPDALGFFGSGKILGVPVPVVIFIAVAVVVYFVLNHTTYGKSLYATGSNPVAAWLAGVNVKRILFSVYAVAGLLAGLAAFTMLGRMMFASSRSLEGLEIDSIAAATVGGISLMGGRGTIIGVILGTLIMGVITNGMTVLNADPSTEGIAKGAIIIVAVTIDYIRRRRGG